MAPEVVGLEEVAAEAEEVAEVEEAAALAEVEEAAALAEREAEVPRS